MRLVKFYRDFLSWFINKHQEDLEIIGCNATAASHIFYLLHEEHYAVKNCMLKILLRNKQAFEVTLNVNITLQRFIENLWCLIFLCNSSIYPRASFISCFSCLRYTSYIWCKARKFSFAWGSEFIFHYKDLHRGSSDSLTYSSKFHLIWENSINFVKIQNMKENLKKKNDGNLFK